MRTLFVKEARHRAALLVVFVLVAFLLKARHDYLAYQWIWADILAGKNPWFNGGVWNKNAYGVVFNSFALIYTIHPLLPKLVFVSLWWGVGVATLVLIGKRNLNPRWVSTFFFFNPLFWFEFISWGHNEPVVGALIFGAIWCHQTKRQFLSGLLLAAGVHFKVYPIVLLPVFWVRPKVHWYRWNHRFLIGAFLGVGLGVGLSVTLWGLSAFYPVTFGGTRPAEGLSFFKYLTGSLSPFHLEWSAAQLGKISKVLLAASSTTAVWVFWKGRISFVRAAGVQLLLVLLCYPVGYIQYQHSLLFLFPLIAAEFKTTHSQRWPRLRALMVSYVAFLVAYCTFIGLRGQYHPWVESVQQWISIPYTIVALLLLHALWGRR